MTTIPASEYEAVTRRGNVTVLHFGAVETDGMVTCAECSVRGEYDASAIEAEYNEWKGGAK